MATGLSQIHTRTSTLDPAKTKRNTPRLQEEPTRSVNTETKAQSVTFSSSTEGLPSPSCDEDKRFGRHGDIKPENILWYKNHSPCTDIGVLKISDFGLARWHSDKSRTAPRPPRMKASPTYRAPEIDLPGQNLSRKYDIWTLGCVYLGLITWYLKGWDAVHGEFSTRRIDDDIPDDSTPGIHEDKYFNVLKTDAGELYAEVKPAITQVRFL